MSSQGAQATWALTIFSHACLALSERKFPYRSKAFAPSVVVASFAASTVFTAFLYAALANAMADDKALQLRVSFSSYSLCSLVFFSQSFTLSLRYLGLNSQIEEPHWPQRSLHQAPSATRFKINSTLKH